MPSPIAHAVSGYAIARLWPDARPPWPRRWLLFYTVFIAVAADLDFVPQFITGERYHHGFTHSITFALGVSLVAWCIAHYVYKQQRACQLGVLTLALYGSHLALDVITQGGAGIQLLWPFTTEYYQSSVLIFPSTHWSKPLLRYPGHFVFLAFELVYTVLIIGSVWFLQNRQRQVRE